MVRDLSISREIEKFSFIRTIHSHHNNNPLEGMSEKINEVDSIDSQVQDISALCKTDSQTNSSSLAIDRSATISDRWYALDTIKDRNHLFPIVILPESPLPDKSDRKGFNYYLDRILLIIASGYLCFVFWWLFGMKNAMFLLPFFSPEETISQADAEFIDYMKQSLEIVDRKLEKTKESSELQAESSEIKTPEVVYVPVFTPTPKTVPQPNTLLPPPPPPNQLAAMNSTITATSTSIKSPAPPSESVKVKTIPTVPSEAKSTTETTSQKPHSSETVVAKTSNTKTTANHTLVGVMELNEGSAALFKVNGVTQKIGLGNKIENTDWVLDSVANQKVQISSQGKTLTLSVGENFN